MGLAVSVSAEAAGDAVRGKTLGYTCLGCHGIESYKNVYPTFSVPRLRGQHPEYIVAALKSYRNGQRSHATMHAHASSLSDQDILDVAAYLAGTPLKSVSDYRPVGSAPAAVAVCAACHGNDGVGNIGLLSPTLSGQHTDYLEHALEGYRSGARKDPVMSQQAEMLKPEDIRAVAEYYARQKPALATVPRNEKKTAAAR